MQQVDTLTITMKLLRNKKIKAFITKLKRKTFKNTRELLEKQALYGGLLKTAQLHAPPNKKIKLFTFLSKINYAFLLISFLSSAYHNHNDFGEMATNLLMFGSFIVGISYGILLHLKMQVAIELLDWCEKQKGVENEIASRYGLKKTITKFEIMIWILAKVTISSTSTLMIFVVATSPITFWILFGQYATTFPMFYLIKSDPNPLTFAVSILNQTWASFYATFFVNLLLLIFISSLCFLYHRFGLLIELVKEMGKRVTDEKKTLDSDLLKLIVDLEVDAFQ